MSGPQRIGVDTGGTFTDLVATDASGGERVHKLPSTPSAPGDAVVAGLGALAAAGGTAPLVVHGTTVALNALLTGDLARTAFVTDVGFADWIEVGRQTRPELYELEPRLPPPIAPRELRFEVSGRLVPQDERGFQREPGPSDAELRELVQRLRSAQVESVAVGLLHSYADPGVERQVANALAELGVPVTCSAELVPEHREYERFETALVNAALGPRMAAYLLPLAARVAEAAPGAHLALMQSAGGSLAAERASAEPVRVLLSGPAGGVVGATAAAREAGFDSLVALDMGGTSTDVAFARAGLGGVRSADAVRSVQVAGRAIAVPCLDLHTIGCGGGSLVRVDAGGVLHVGPASAGADPGPVAYGRSEAPTITDAHVLLGHVSTGAFLGGGLELDVDAVARAFETLAGRLGSTPVATAQAVLDAARAAMRRALGVMTLERGQDPRHLPLVAFGGAGGLHAAALAESLGMRAALVPRHPGALSAWGMTRTGALCERASTVLAPFADLSPAQRAARFAELERDARAELADEGVPAHEIVCERELDLRYRGQSFELRVSEGDDPAGAFEAVHERLYGYRLEGAPLELVCLRVRARGVGMVVDGAAGAPGAESRPEPWSTRRAWFAGSEVELALHRRADLASGSRLVGPAAIEEYSGTVLVPPGYAARVGGGGHLVLGPASGPGCKGGGPA